MKRTIPIAKPYFTGQETEKLAEVIASGWITQGPMVRRFEEMFRQRLGCEYTVALSSCTAALHLALIAHSIGPVDEVIVPAFTFAATANVVELIGAKTVFCDINLDTFTMNPSSFEKQITKKTKAVIPVHLFGLAADMDPIISIANEHGLIIIEDAACAYGTTYRGKPAGLFGTCGAFSFHPRKSLTTGEGGLLVTNNVNIYKLVTSLCNHGSDNVPVGLPHAMSDIIRPGFNYRLTDIQAALGISQLEASQTILSTRRAIAVDYDRILSHIPWLKTPRVPEGIDHAYQAYVCLFMPESITPSNIGAISRQRNTFMAFLAARGIATRPGTHAVHCLSYYRNKYNLSPHDCINTWIAAECSVTLPLYPGITSEDIEYIHATIVDFGRESGLHMDA